MPFLPLAFQSLSVATPWALLALLLLPAWWLWRRRHRPPAIIFSRAGTLQSGPRAGRRLARTIFVLRNLALALAIIALARPRSSGQAVESSSTGVNIVIAFDISSSMLAEDFQPRNRLEVAREKVAQFVTFRRNDRIGLVAFSGEALTQVPLTTDYPVVQAAIQNMQPGQLEDGTAIGTAIATAANRLRDATGKSRVLVLFTDGVNNRGSLDPLTAAKAAAAFGIRIYAVGVGTRGMAPVPVGRGLFGLRYEMRQVEIDDALLTEVATSTGGRYYRATSTEGLDRITREIDRLERTPLQTTSYTRYTELFVWPLGLALLLLFAELALSAWRGPLP